MAILKLSCKNQALEWENNSEEIIAGNIKIDKIAFEFCELWDGFTKTAVFRKDDKALLVLLDNDCICEMPPEVTQTSGIVYIGVFGVKGDQKRTTEVKGLYLAEGVVTDGKTPGEPTPDIYQQILNLCAEAVDTSKRVEAETKELNEQSKVVLDAEAERMAAEEYRQYSEDERKNNELLRDEHESNRQGAEEERQQSFEELKSETGILLGRMSEGLSDFKNEGQNALNQFQADTSTALSGFDVERQQALDHFAEQSAEELEKVQTATDRANEAVDNMPNIYANALKGTASGEVVSISDVAPIEHNMAVKLSSKNLLSPPIFNGVSNGVSIVVDENGVISCNGTATADIYYRVIGTGKRLELPIGNYVLSGCPSGGGWGSYILYISNLTISKNLCEDSGNSGLLKIDEANDGNNSLFLFIKKGTVLDNVVFNPMLEKGTSATSYTPYFADISTVKLIVEESGLMYTPNADGTVEGVKSIYPTTTLAPSEQGVLVECEYNRDLNKAIEEITNAIIALGGNI